MTLGQPMVKYATLIRHVSTESASTVHFYGDFYTLPDGLRCRSTLEIVTTQRDGTQLAHLSCHEPDLVVIMANPGGSRPTAAFEWQQREPARIGELVNLREAVPDQTQTKIVAIMESRQYNHVRVLNLSDVCKPSLSGLIQTLKARQADTGDSVFADPLRAEELDRRLNPRCGLVVAAWSYESAAALTHRGKTAYEKVMQRQLRVIGVEGRFAHPSRSGTWADDLVATLGDG